MTNQECVEHLQRLKMGINIINSLCPASDRDMVDLEALDYAIAKLKEDKE